MSISDIPPGLYTLIAEALGIYVARNLRLNDQNSIGNWLQLVGQVILAYNSQQQLRQQGPATHPTDGINYEYARLAAAVPLTLIIDELPNDLLQDPVMQQKLAEERAVLNGQMQANQPTALSQMSGSGMAVKDSDNINMLQSRVENLESRIQELEKQVETLKGNDSYQ